MKTSFKHRLNFIIKHFYIAILIMVIFGSVTLLIINKIPKYYESKSILLIEDNKEYNYQNYQTYTKYVKNSDLIKNLEFTYQNVNSNNISINLLSNSKLVEIRVKNSDMHLSLEMNNVLSSLYKEQILNIYPNMQLFTISSASIIDASNINTNHCLIIALISGLVVGIMILNIYSSGKIHIYNHKDIRKYLNIKTLGVIPSENSVPYEKTKNVLYDTKIRMINKPDSIISESYRMVRTNLDFLNLKIINFTSTSIGEGKSATISNIAVSFALMGKRVLLIDCDLRKPRIHRNFHINRSLGLTDVICYNRLEEYENIIQEFKIKNTNYHLDILSAGSKVVNPSEMLSSNRFKKLMNMLKDEYDLILIDCPPVSLMTDAAIVSRISNGTVYVVEYDRISSSIINSNIETLKNLKVNILGAVITKVNIKRQRKLYGSKYEYYHDYIA